MGRKSGKRKELWLEQDPKDGEAGPQTGADRSWGRRVYLDLGHSRRNYQIPPGRDEGQINSLLTEGQAQKNLQYI